ncbi:hypothetical protein IAD21_00874 [Abditibacteriota bacterium]|nr:hypothetical protein IAD21_00874 [Abditibacteriota bacterium]
MARAFTNFIPMRCALFFDDFKLGLTFPGAVDAGLPGSKRRSVLSRLSGEWHGFVSWQQGLTNELLIQFFGGSGGDTYEEEDEDDEDDEQYPPNPISPL